MTGETSLPDNILSFPKRQKSSTSDVLTGAATATGPDEILQELQALRNLLETERQRPLRATATETNVTLVPLSLENPPAEQLDPRVRVFWYPSASVVFLANTPVTIGPIVAAPAKSNEERHESLPPMVRMDSLLRRGAVLAALVAALSLVSWATGDFPAVIVNPFASLMVIVLSPFVYWMGYLISRPFNRRIK